MAGYLSRTERMLLARFVALVEERAPGEVRAIRVFGSRARGDSHEGSDLDVAIEPAEGFEFHRLRRITFDAAWDAMEELGPEALTLAPVVLPMDGRDGPGGGGGGAGIAGLADRGDGLMAPLPAAEHAAKVPESLRGAIGALVEGAWGTAVQACYCAALHMALALLADRGVLPQTRTGAATMLGLHFIKPSHLPPHLARELTALSGLRHMADYGLVSGLDIHGAHEAARRAITFIEALVPLLPAPPAGLDQQVGRLQVLLVAQAKG